VRLSTVADQYRPGRSRRVLRGAETGVG